MSSTIGPDSITSTLKQPIEKLLYLLRLANDVDGSSEGDVAVLIGRVEPVWKSMQLTSSSLEEVLRKAKANNAALEQVRTTVESEKTALEQERSAIARERSALDQAKSTFEPQMSEAQKRLETARSVADKINTAAKYQRGERDTLFGQEKEVQVLMAQSEDILATKKTQYKALEEHHTSIEQDLARMKDEIDRHREQALAQTTERLQRWERTLEQDIVKYASDQGKLDLLQKTVARRESDAISKEMEAEDQVRRAQEALRQAQLLDQSNQKHNEQILDRQQRLEMAGENLRAREDCCRETEEKVKKSFHQATAVEAMARRTLFHFQSTVNLTLEEAVENCDETESLMFRELNELREECHQHSIDNGKLEVEHMQRKAKSDAYKYQLGLTRRQRDVLEANQTNLLDATHSKESLLQREQAHVAALREEIKQLQNRLDLADEQFECLKKNGMQAYNQKILAEENKTKLAKQRITMLEQQLASKEELVTKSKDLLIQYGEDLDDFINATDAGRVSDASPIRRLRSNHAKLTNKANFHNEVPREQLGKSQAQNASADAAQSEANLQRHRSCSLPGHHQEESPGQGSVEYIHRRTLKRVGPITAPDGRETKRRNAVREGFDKTTHRREEIDSRDSLQRQQGPRLSYPSKFAVDRGQLRGLITEDVVYESVEQNGLSNGSSSSRSDQPEHQSPFHDNPINSHHLQHRPLLSKTRSSVHASIEHDDSNISHPVTNRQYGLDETEDEVRRSPRVRLFRSGRQRSSAQQSANLMGPPTPHMNTSRPITQSSEVTPTNLKVLSLRIADIREGQCRDLPDQLLDKITTFVSTLDRRKSDWEARWATRNSESCLRQNLDKKTTNRDHEGIACRDCRTAGGSRLCLRLKGPGLVEIMPSARQGQSENDEGYWLCA